VHDRNRLTQYPLPFLGTFGERSNAFLRTISDRLASFLGAARLRGLVPSSLVRSRLFAGAGKEGPQLTPHLAAGVQQSGQCRDGGIARTMLSLKRQRLKFSAWAGMI